MSASEIIEQIKALPPDEKAEVVRFVHGLETADDSCSQAFKDAAERMFDRYDDLFKKLAQ